tara:strand:+ start:303 stop:524 length:222 start_codon:yes stop_codon:yes gene_type:complete
MKILKEYISFIVENNQSFLDIYNSYVDEQQPNEEDQQQEKERKEKERKEKERKEANVNMLVDPYAYLNFPAKK